MSLLTSKSVSLRVTSELVTPPRCQDSGGLGGPGAGAGPGNSVVQTVVPPAGRASHGPNGNLNARLHDSASRNHVTRPDSEVRPGNHSGWPCDHVRA